MSNDPKPQYSDEQIELMRETLTKPGEPMPLPLIVAGETGYWVVEFLRAGQTKTESASTIHRSQGEAAESARLMMGRYGRAEMVYAVAVPVDIVRRSL